MRRRLLPLGLAALLFNPSFAQTIDIGRGGTYEISNGSAPRAVEPTSSLSLKAALSLAFGASPELSGARRELEAIEATIIQAQVRPNPELATLIEDTEKATHFISQSWAPQLLDLLPRDATSRSFLRDFMNDPGKTLCWRMLGVFETDLSQVTVHSMRS